ncbi:MAG: LPS assembly lipoprotein LptE [Pseudomonadota bacterium]
MMRMLCVLALLGLAGCGFEPLYATGPSAANVPDALKQIAVMPLKDRSGQLLQTALQRRLQAGGSVSTAPYNLDIALRQSVQGFGIRGDAAPTRQRVRMVADYRLLIAEEDKEVFSGTAFADTTFDIVNSEYATFIAEETATERNTQIIAERILSRLALYFRAVAEAEKKRGTR